MKISGTLREDLSTLDCYQQHKIAKEVLLIATSSTTNQK
jgi:hypothetical protein